MVLVGLVALMDPEDLVDLMDLEAQWLLEIQQHQQD
jgi:hypothetical protein